jgi:hypothetical protein
LFVVSMYLLPLGLSLLFWTVQDSSKWAGGFVSLANRLLVGLWQATGPFAWVLMNSFGKLEILIAFGVAWSAWLIVVLSTRLRQLPYVVHFGASFLWCISGCPPAGLVIT